MNSSMKFTPVIGLEIHVELSTNSKMFCGCPAEHFGQTPNTHLCPVCFGLPGALPVANEEGIKRTVKIGLALDCQIAEHSKFDRKNYFYPDLPKGYQISQYDQPLCFAGVVETSLGPVRITRVHLEEDTAKLQHVTLTPDEMKAVGVEHSDVSLLDFNRSGVPLVEIVTEPDIRSGEHAREYGKSLVQLLRYLDVSDCDMEKGSLRLEANISVQTEEEKAAGKLPPYKVEVKNLNSFRFLERAINYEIARHSEMRERGELPAQETRGWNDEKGITYSQRSKEEAEDYRYFPDPDLPVLKLSQKFVNEIRESLVELPKAKRQRFLKEFQLSEQNAEVVTGSRLVAEVIEQLLTQAQSAKVEPQQVANGLVNHKIESWLLDSDHVERASADEVTTEQQIVLKAAIELYRKEEVDEKSLRFAVETVLDNPTNAASIESFKAGKVQAVGPLMGQTLKVLGKKVDPKQIKLVLEQMLQER